MYCCFPKLSTCRELQHASSWPKDQLLVPHARLGLVCKLLSRCVLRTNAANAHCKIIRKSSSLKLYFLECDFELLLS